MHTRTLPFLLLLGACGDPIESEWTGSCGSPVGEIGLSTTELKRSEGTASQWSGEHTLYTGSGTLAFPESEITSDLDLVICDDPDGCKAPTVDYNDGDLIAMFYDEGGGIRLTGWGPLEGTKSMTGRCRTTFGDGDFTFER